MRSKTLDAINDLQDGYEAAELYLSDAITDLGNMLKEMARQKAILRVRRMNLAKLKLAKKEAAFVEAVSPRRRP